MSKKIELNVEKPEPPKRSTADILNSDHCGVEFYVHFPTSNAPMMYYICSSREDADEIAGSDPAAEIFVREVSEWRKAP